MTSEGWAIDSYVPSPPPEDFEQVYDSFYGDGGDCDEEAVWIEPLVVAFPAVEVNPVSATRVDSVCDSKGVPEVIKMGLGENVGIWGFSWSFLCGFQRQGIGSIMCN